MKILVRRPVAEGVEIEDHDVGSHAGTDVATALEPQEVGGATVMLRMAKGSVMTWPPGPDAAGQRPLSPSGRPAIRA